MLTDINLQVHNIECLLVKSKTLGVLSSLQDAYSNKKNAVLIVKYYR